MALFGTRYKPELYHSISHFPSPQQTMEGITMYALVAGILLADGLTRVWGNLSGQARRDRIADVHASRQPQPITYAVRRHTPDSNTTLARISATNRYPRILTPVLARGDAEATPLPALSQSEQGARRTSTVTPHRTLAYMTKRF